MPHIIDGHNLIGTGLIAGIRLGDPDDEVQLVEQLRAYRARGGPAMVVFFDSGGLPGGYAMGGATPRIAGMDVYYSAADQIADDEIVAYLARQRQPGQCTVVTSDAALAQRARLAGANVVSAQHFAQGMFPRERPAHKGRGASTTPERPTPAAKDPAFVDIYATFVEVEQSARANKGARAADFDIWVTRLLNDDAQIAQRAAMWLGMSQRAEATEPLCTALLHDDPGVRAAAALGLGALGAQDALGDLLGRLQADDNSMVREAAAQTLGRIGNRTVEDALQTAARFDRKSKVRKAAQAALVQIRARRS